MIKSAKNLAIFNGHKHEILFRCRRVISALIFFLGVVYYYIKKKKAAAVLLMRSHRIYGRDRVLKFILKHELFYESIISDLYSKGVSIEEAARRSIITKFPSVDGMGCIEKGILIITFTRTFGFYLREIDIAKLSEYFYVVLEPSWAGYVDPDILGWASKTDNIVYVQATEVQDRVALGALSLNLRPLSFGASDWVDYEVFSPDDFQKEYDSIYVANTNPIKRVERYFRAIHNIIKKYPEYKGCLVCANWGSGSTAEISKLASIYDIEKNIEIMFGLDKEKLKEELNKSKVNVLLSYKEGSNRSLFESIFMDIPVICLVENMGVNKSYINEHTGIITSNLYLENALVDMRDRWSEFSPRNWALKNISPHVTTEKLVTILNSYENSYIKLNDVLVKINNPELSYFEYKNLDYYHFNKEVLSLFLKGVECGDVGVGMKRFEASFNTLFLKTA